MTRNVYGTDSGPPCPTCGEGIWAYRPSQGVVNALCVCCHHSDTFPDPTTPGGTTSVQQLRAAHFQRSTP